MKDQPAILNCLACQQILSYLDPLGKASQKEINSYMMSREPPITTTPFHITSHLAPNQLVKVTSEGVIRTKYVTILELGKRSLADARKKSEEKV